MMCDVLLYRISYLKILGAISFVLLFIIWVYNLLECRVGASVYNVR